MSTTIDQLKFFDDVVAAIITQLTMPADSAAAAQAAKQLETYKASLNAAEVEQLQFRADELVIKTAIAVLDIIGSVPSLVSPILKAVPFLGSAVNFVYLTELAAQAQSELRVEPFQMRAETAANIISATIGLVPGGGVVMATLKLITGWAGLAVADDFAHLMQATVNGVYYNNVEVNAASLALLTDTGVFIRAYINDTGSFFSDPLGSGESAKQAAYKNLVKNIDLKSVITLATKLDVTAQALLETGSPAALGRVALVRPSEYWQERAQLLSIQLKGDITGTYDGTPTYGPEAIYEGMVGNRKISGYVGIVTPLIGDTIQFGLQGSEAGSYFANDKYWGTAGVDVYHGNGGDDVIYGFEGDDILNGGRGDDTYVYRLGDGNDSITLGGGADKIIFQNIDASTVSLHQLGAQAFFGLQGGEKIFISDFFTNDITLQVQFEGDTHATLTRSDFAADTYSFDTYDAAGRLATSQVIGKDSFSSFTEYDPAGNQKNVFTSADGSRSISRSFADGSVNADGVYSDGSTWDFSLTVDGISTFTQEGSNGYRSRQVSSPDGKSLFEYTNQVSTGYSYTGPGWELSSTQFANGEYSLKWTQELVAYTEFKNLAAVGKTYSNGYATFERQTFNEGFTVETGSWLNGDLYRAQFTESANSYSWTSASGDYAGYAVDKVFNTVSYGLIRFDGSSMQWTQNRDGTILMQQTFSTGGSVTHWTMAGGGINEVRVKPGEVDYISWDAAGNVVSFLSQDGSGTQHEFAPEGVHVMPYANAAPTMPALLIGLSANFDNYLLVPEFERPLLSV